MNGTSATDADPAAVVPADGAGKYLTFELGRESYGVPVLKVREIIRAVDITPVPRMPSYVKGVFNLRGKVLPVIDLRVRFGLEKAEFTGTTCTIVIHVSHPNGARSLLGLIVDAVKEVSQVRGDQMEPPPDFGFALNTDYIIAMARIKEGITTLLDMDRIVAAEISEATDTLGAPELKKSGPASSPTL